jgi:uncharacterized protein (UPF0332 family)
VRWEAGRAEIDQALNQGRLSRVAPNRALAERYLAAARAHLESARLLTEDPDGAFTLVYDAARKALAAILVNQGLRASSKGGHVAVGDAVTSQLGSVLLSLRRDFTWMRQLRNATEYPEAGDKVADTDDVDDAIPMAEMMIDAAERVIDQMSPY